MELKQGIYEHIINQEIDRKMQEAEQSGLVCVQQPIDGAESPQMLAGKFDVFGPREAVSADPLNLN
ncbi:MAG: hypothetical protein IJZ49_09995 [Alistipes sp.]|nr:hypothetical protein [Alistipes sp.]